jgi:heterodisulfide reductase subunit A
VLDDPSPFALYIVASQVHQLLEQDVGKIVVLVLSQLSGEKELAEAERLGEKSGIELRQAAMFKVDPESKDSLAVSYEDLTARRFVEETYDMVVLCSDVWPAEGLAELAQMAGIRLADNGYISVAGEGGSETATSQPGIFAAGCATGPKNIKDSIATARSAAASALACLDERLLRSDYQPPEPEQTPAPGEAATAATAPLSEDETRARIEKVLYALLDR